MPVNIFLKFNIDRRLHDYQIDKTYHLILDLPAVWYSDQVASLLGDGLTVPLSAVASLTLLNVLGRALVLPFGGATFLECVKRISGHHSL